MKGGVGAKPRNQASDLNIDHSRGVRGNVQFSHLDVQIDNQSWPCSLAEWFLREECMYLEDAGLLEKQEAMIAELERILSEHGCSGLPQWEYDFINSLSRYFRRGKYLTGPQKAVAKKIIKKYQEGCKKPNQGTLTSDTETALAGEKK